MEKLLKIRLYVLSPIHIGCDDVYEPTSFIIDEKRKKLIAFDPIDFIKALNKQEKEELTKACFSDNLLAIFKTIKRLYKSTIKGQEIDIASGLLEHYKKVLSMSTYNKKAVINQFTMYKTVYNPHNNQPYIPGSSLKGSLRTAYLSLLAKEKGIEDYWRKSSLKDKDKAKELEKILLEGSFETDPFRMVKVSDLLPVNHNRTKIVYAINRKKEKSDRTTLAEGSPAPIFETIVADTVFEGFINIGKPSEKSEIKSPITENKLKKAINDFYIPLLESEIKMLKKINIPVLLINKINKNFKSQIKKTAFLIRIGRHSGAEAVTIVDNRYIKIMGRRGEQPRFSKNGATTIWLVSEESKPKSNKGLVPFGWAVVEIVE
jgi:CRISPR-associated protein Csm5